MTIPSAEVQRLQESQRETLYWFLHPRSRALELEGFFHVRMMARQISAGYANLHLPSAGDETAIEIPAYDPSTAHAQDSEYLRPVRELARRCESELKPFLAHSLIHGSLATNDYVRGWSDFDTYFVVNRETCTDPARLVELRELLHRAYSLLTDLDPHQHHGFLLCSELDLQNYPSYFMPLEVLRNSRSLAGPTLLRLRQRPIDRQHYRRRFRSHVTFLEKSVRTRVFAHHAYQGEYLLEDFVNRENALYQLKNFLEFILILPAYFQEALGKPCYKRESFALTRPYLSESDWEILDRASRIRSDWARREQHPYLSNRVPQWIVDTLGGDYLRRTLELVRKLDERLEKIEATQPQK